MGKRRKDLPFIEGLHITTLAAEGKAMGKVDNQVVFVPMTVPGDIVDVQIRKHHRRFMEGVVVNYVEKSPLRVDTSVSTLASAEVASGKISHTRSS